MKRYKFFKVVLLFWTAFIGIGAVAGSIGFLTAIDGSNLGMQDYLPYFQVLPFAEYLFQDFFFAGISLLVVNGITNLVAFVLILANNRKGIFMGTLFGFTLMLWITIQFIILPSNYLSISFFFFGLLQLICGYTCYVSAKQLDLQASLQTYDNPKKSDTLVVTFSRKGHCLDLAIEEAKKNNARLLQLKSLEKTQGDLGFWWCGRFAMHGWPMPLESYSENVSKYKHVIIVSAIWAFGISCPIKAFAIKEKGRIHDAGYLLCHFNRLMDYGYIAQKLDRLLDTTASTVRSVCYKRAKKGQIKILK